MIRLALRLGVMSGLRPSIATTVTALATAIGSLLMLLVLCIAPAMQARADRTAWMDNPVQGAVARGDAAGPPVTYISTGVDYLGAESITVVGVAGTADGAPVPPGMVHLPRSGTALLSPALTRLVNRWPEAAGRYGVPVGELGPDALAGPDALVVVRGLALDQAVLEGQPVAAFPRTGEVLALEGILRVLMVVGGIAMLAPVLLLVTIGTRLSVRSRETRLSALRLAGATRGQVSWFAAVEAVVPGIVGIGLGFALLYLLRPLAAYVNYDSGRWYVSDLAPDRLGVIFVAVGVPLVTVLATLSTLSRVQRDPLATRRQSRPSTVSAWRAAPLLLVLPALAVVTTVPGIRNTLGSSGRVAAVAFALLVLALHLAGPFLVRAVGMLLARSGRVPVLLAGRRMVNDPRVVYRSVSGVVLAIMVTSLFVVTTPAAAESLETTSGSGQRAGTAQAVVFYATPAQTAQMRDRLSSIDGISAVTPVYEAMLETNSSVVRAWIGDCRSIATATSLPSVPCGSAPLVATDDVAAHLRLGQEPRPQMNSLWSNQVTALTAPPPEGFDSAVEVPSGTVAVMPPPGGMDLPALIVDPKLLGSVVSTLRPTLLLLRYDDDHALERARTVVVSSVSGGYVSTRQSAYDGFSKDVRRLYRIVLIATLGVFLMASFSLVVAVLLGLVERRRPFALMRAGGAAVSVLRRAMMLEAAVPMVMAALLAGLSGALLGTWVVAGHGGGTEVQWQALALPVIAGTILCLTMTLTAMPFVGRITDGEATRTE
ncbi:ABC transporter permease [Polymorphospora sp. NPDC051019]|uniref:ABC transporter permease n=1 Tax=Polymorphospora sp. NPDC051019 TaxID=3155725 RepID=UPI0034477DC8